MNADERMKLAIAWLRDVAHRRPASMHDAHDHALLVLRLLRTYSMMIESSARVIREEPDTAERDAFDDLAETPPAGMSRDEETLDRFLELVARRVRDPRSASTEYSQVRRKPESP